MVPLGPPLDDDEYARLLAFRIGLRQFLRWSAEQAATVGLTPTQHQLLLAIRGHRDPRGPSVGDVAGYLCTRHHSAVQLIDRTEQLGLVTRTRADGADRRIVRLTLTAAGTRKLAELSAAHLEELRRLAPLLDALLEPAISRPFRDRDRPTGGRQMDAATSEETYEFVCRRCRQQWQQDYQIRRWVDCDGDEHVACTVAGIPVAPPWSAPPCPHCGGYRTMLLPQTTPLLSPAPAPRPRTET